MGERAAGMSALFGVFFDLCCDFEVIFDMRGRFSTRAPVSG
jgi:hypothetical protein